MIELTKPFWREEPFSDAEHLLVYMLFKAHHESAFRENPSTVSAVNGAMGSGALTGAIIGALSTLGGKHAPIIDVMSLLWSDATIHPLCKYVESHVKTGTKLPGWGGSFQGKSEDPIWQPVAKLIAEQAPHLAKEMDDVTKEFHRLGKIIYPNPSAYTACVALIVGMPRELAPFLFIAGRLCGWTQIAASHLNK